MSNSLAGETSPYLLQHAENPVDWLPWGEAALELARRQDKPIFLSIGYAACHWCHVMAHESFEDPETAAALNRDFVSIKVDREERPDVDSVYMEAVVALNGQGGWPLSVFLTPDGRPFFGGTYFPPQTRHGLPAFRDVLQAVQAAWTNERPRLEDTARRLVEHAAQESTGVAPVPTLDVSGETRAMEALLRAYDWEYGGWGGAPKFPQAGTISLLLRRHHRTGDRMALDMGLHCLAAMGRGGVFDHLGGGFHRYAVDRTWTVPHFEKMLYDNALLARVYLEAWQVTRDPELRRIGEATLSFLRTELRTPEGGFSASLDADSEGEEGRYYVWSLDQLEAVLGPKRLDQLRATLDLPAGGNFEGNFVLRRPVRRAGETESVAPGPTTEFQGELQASLLEQRSRRLRPALDDKVIAAWNGLALSAWATAARALKRSEDLTTAQELASFLWTALRPGGRLHRSYRLRQARHEAQLDDHAALAEGFLDLYQADFDPVWLNHSAELAEAILDRFVDPKGGFFDTPSLPPGLPTRPRTVQDTPVPSGSTLAVSLFLHLEALTGETRFRNAVLPGLQGMQEAAIRYPTAFSGWLQNLGLAASPVPQLALVGARGSPDLSALADEAHERFLPRLALAAGASEESNAPLLLRQKPMLGGKATAYLCRDFTCLKPTTDAAELRGQLEEAR